MNTPSAMIDQPDSAESIRREMAELRCQLREDFDGAAAQAKELVDWKHYVKQAPWAAMGVAAITAFAAVPRKLQVDTVDAKAAAKLAEQNRVVVRSKPEAAARSGLGGFLVKTALTMATRMAIGVATQKAAEFGMSTKTASAEAQAT